MMVSLLYSWNLSDKNYKQSAFLLYFRADCLDFFQNTLTSHRGKKKKLTVKGVKFWVFQKSKSGHL